MPRLASFALILLAAMAAATAVRQCSAQTGDAADPKWRRTIDGWERADLWETADVGERTRMCPPPPKPWLHPGALAGIQIAVAMLLAASKNESGRTPSGTRRRSSFN